MNASNLSRPLLRLKSAQRDTAGTPAPEPEPAPDQFFFNWRRGGSRPKKRHATRKLAQAEAERLRSVCPGAIIDTYEARKIP